MLCNLNIEQHEKVVFLLVGSTITSKYMPQLLVGRGGGTRTPRLPGSETAQAVEESKQETVHTFYLHITQDESR